MRRTSSRTIRKSSPFGFPLENAPGTFSQMKSRGRINSSAIPVRLSAFRISFVIRICSMKRPERAPARPARVPATDRSWQGLPPQMISTGRSSSPRSFVMSPTCCMPGKWRFVTSMGKASISLAQRGMIPLRNAASGNPPIPSKRLPKVKVTPWTFPSLSWVRNPWTGSLPC